MGPRFVVEGEMIFYVECLAVDARLVIEGSEIASLRNGEHRGLIDALERHVRLCQLLVVQSLLVEREDGRHGGIFLMNEHPRRIANLIAREVLI